MTLSIASPQKTVGIHVRNVPVETAEILAEDAKTLNRSREGHIRAILNDHARRLMARRQKEGRRD